MFCVCVEFVYFDRRLMEESYDRLWNCRWLPHCAAAPSVTEDRAQKKTYVTSSRPAPLTRICSNPLKDT